VILPSASFSTSMISWPKTALPTGANSLPLGLS
jgi:hypothetical protein